MRAVRPAHPQERVPPCFVFGRMVTGARCGPGVCPTHRDRGGSPPVRAERLPGDTAKSPGESSACTQLVGQVRFPAERRKRL